MPEFSRLLQIRWSDLDPNFHLRHSVYYDWGAFCRVEFLNENGLTAEVMQRLQFGPILFKEECVFRREIKMADEVTIHLELTRARKDFSRWSILHRIIRGEHTLCAELRVDGAWMHTVERKLTSPPPQVQEVFEKMPRTTAFEWL